MPLPPIPEDISSFANQLLGINAPQNNSKNLNTFADLNNLNSIHTKEPVIIVTVTIFTTVK